MSIVESSDVVTAESHQCDLVSHGHAHLTSDSTMRCSGVEVGDMTSTWMAQQVRLGSISLVPQAQGQDWTCGVDVDRLIGFISGFKNPLVEGKEQPYESGAAGPQHARPRNPNYRFESVSAVDYGFYLPARPDYCFARDRVLNAFQSEAGIVSIPAVAAYLERYPKERGGIGKLLGGIVGGFSRGEVDGRFGQEDERSWYFEITVLDISGSVSECNKFRLLSRVVINHLITRRLAEEIGLEQEIWAKQLRETHIDRWVQVAA